MTSVTSIQDPPTDIKSFGLAWWNAHDFYHYDHSKINKSGSSRWPKSLAEYKEKCDRIDRALGALFRENGTPNILALGEITRQAAQELRDRILPGYKLISLDTIVDKPALQIALLYSQTTGLAKLTEQAPIVVPNTPHGTRPMAVLDIRFGAYRVRCIICHWQAKFEDEQDVTRERIGTYLSEYVYDFLHHHSKERRSVMIVGDLNDEPFGLPQKYLNAHRFRGRSLGPSHHANADVKRTHLYNCSWRQLGEKHPHDPRAAKGAIDVAGTYYWARKHSWLNLDQIIVSGGLLGHEPPYIDENKTAIVSLPEFLPEGLPSKFSLEGNTYKGLSDHLPIITAIQMGK